MQHQLHHVTRLLVITTIMYTALSTEIPAPQESAPSPKAWNFMVYMCNNNNLHKYAINNFQQMTKLGSSPYVNLLLQLDTQGEKSITRYYIERHHPKTIQTVSNTATSFSGTPENLYEFVQWGIKNYPAEKTCLVLSNHGTGIKDPHAWGRALMQIRDKLFALNAQSGLLEIDRKRARDVSFLRELENIERGIAFNEVAQVYLTNEDLRDALNAIAKDVLKGKKIDVLAMDACYMSMIEVASQVKNAAHFMVGSEEVEPGTGYNYQYILEPLMNNTLKDHELAENIVASFSKEYLYAIGDFTQAAIDLSHVDDVEIALNRLSATFIELLGTDQKNAYKIIADIRNNPNYTTEFLDTDYIDVMHFLKSFVNRSNELCQDADKDWFSFFFTNKDTGHKLWHNAREAALDCIAALGKVIVANACGKNFNNAHGVSIYFPKNSIKASYYQTEFAKATMWPLFLKKFLGANKRLKPAIAEPNPLDDLLTGSVTTI
ncbi:MAG: clostripain-related cysteine peptidase [Candidatus Babeliales bacterium]